MTEPVIIPHDRIDEPTLRRLVAEFVSRDGTDYGFAETPMDKKIERALAAIRDGLVLVSFDPVSQSTTLVSKDDVDPESN